MSRSRRNRGQFKPGSDPRRHLFAAEERRRGGLSCARKYTVCGRWHGDWHERCSKLQKGDY